MSYGVMDRAFEEHMLNVLGQLPAGACHKFFREWELPPEGVDA